MTTGNKQIDDDHKTLFAAANELFDTVENDGEDPEKLLTILNQFGSHAFYHFEEEEKLLKEMESPEYKEHKAKHDEYREVIQDFINRTRSEQKVCETPEGCKSIAESAAEFVHDWMKNHIMTHTPLDIKSIQAIEAQHSAK